MRTDHSWSSASGPCSRAVAAAADGALRAWGGKPAALSACPQGRPQPCRPDSGPVNHRRCCRRLRPGGVLSCESSPATPGRAPGDVARAGKPRGAAAGTLQWPWAGVARWMALQAAPPELQPPGARLLLACTAVHASSQRGKKNPWEYASNTASCPLQACAPAGLAGWHISALKGVRCCALAYMNRTCVIEVLRSAPECVASIWHHARRMLPESAGRCEVRVQQLLPTRVTCITPISSSEQAQLGAHHSSIARL